MPNYTSIRRLHLLIEKLSGNQYWSIEDLLSYMMRCDIEVSDRTVKRDINTLRTDYGLEVCYSRNHKGYKVEKDESGKLELVQRFFQSSATVHLIKDMILEPEQFDSIISYQTDHTRNGSAYIKPLLDAINNGLIVSFRHENLKNDTFTARKAEPYFLKEYKARWYMLAYDLDAQDYRLFGLDRVTDVAATDELFTKRGFDPQTYFKDTFGVYTSKERAEEIQLEVKGLTAKLMAKVPVHPSQRIVSINGETYIFSLLVKPTVEVRNYILSLGRHAKVLKPQKLADEIREQLILALVAYK